MKSILFLILIMLIGCASISAQRKTPVARKKAVAVSDDKPIDESIKKLSVVRKNQIGELLREIYVSKDIYLTSTDSDEIAQTSIATINEIRSFAESLPDGFFKANIITGAGAWEKSFLFRFEKETGQQIPLATKKQIIQAYKLENIQPEDRASKLFDYAQAFFDVAADVAVNSGVKPTNK